MLSRTHSRGRSHTPTDDAWAAVTKVLFVLLLFSSLLGYAQIPYLHLSFFNLSHPLLASALLLLHCGRAVETFRRHRAALLALALLYLWIWISALLSVLPGVALRYSLKYSLHIIAFLAFLTITSRKQDNRGFYCLTYRFLILLAVLGVAEYFAHGAPIFAFLRSPDSLGDYPRISSIMQGPNQYSALLSLGVLLGLLCYGKQWISRIEIGLGTLLLVSASSLAGSWNGWLLLSLGVLLALFYRITTVRSIAAILTLLVALGLLIDLSTHGPPAGGIGRMVQATWNRHAEHILLSHHERFRIRFWMWRAALDATKTRPLTGVGIQVFGRTIGKQIIGNEHYHAHNLLLNVAAETGIPGLLLFLTFVYIVVKHADLGTPIVAIPVIMMLFSQIFDYYMHDLTYTTLSLFFVAQALNSRNDPA